MVTDSLTQLIIDYRDKGITLVPDGDKLLVQGSKPSAAMVRRLSALLDKDRAAVLTAAKQVAAMPVQVWDLPAFDQPPATGDPRFDAPVTPDMLSDANIAPTDKTTLAYYKHYVGKVVCDEVMTTWYMDAHRHGFRLTSTALGCWWEECDYRVTEARFA